MKFKILFFLVFISFKICIAQEYCNSLFLEYRNIEPPWELNYQAEALCESDKAYGLIISIYQGYEYRLSFYASFVFDNNINFKIIDMNTKEIIFDEKGGAALIPYYDLTTGKQIHPFFEFYPKNTTNLKIEIIIENIETDITFSENTDTPVKKTGFVSVVLLEKKTLSND